MPYQIPSGGARRPRFLPILIGLVVVLLIFARSISSYIIEYQWWREVGQVQTWFSMLAYQTLPVCAGAALAFVVLWMAHSRAVRFAGVRLRDHRVYAWIATAGVLVIAVILSSSTIDTWVVVRYFGGHAVPAEAAGWRDAVFNQPLKFYLFDLPFYQLLLGYVLGLSILGLLVYWLAARLWQLRSRFTDIQEMQAVDLRILGLEGAFRSVFLRVLGAVLLLALAVRFYFGRYEMLYNDHGFMVGMDYVDQVWRLPLQWGAIFVTVLAAVLILLARWRWVLLIPAVLLVKAVLPAAVGAFYVRPNEISLEQPYIRTHIQATRAAFGLEKNLKETEFKGSPSAKFDPAANQAVLSNTRLWEWQAFHDSVTQLQALRTYYKFSDTDIDRYVIDGQLRQVMITPRELDINSLSSAAGGGWPNRHVIYTHGYGVVLAEANRITPEGLPVLFIQDMPPTVSTPSLKLKRPELYYGEVTHEPVFVHTAQKEFNYPSGSSNEFSTYQGKGGFPVASLPMRVAAAFAEADPNILLTSYLTGQSRMMIRRNVRDRLEQLAGFLSWDKDPYLVLTDSGRLVWTLDGYTTSDAHPYSRRVGLEGEGDFNYIRNAVKATVDAYDGETHLYVFDPADPIIRAYQQLFPKLFLPKSAMPADLRMHARYPETLFRVQAGVYRTFHMQDPQAFYNREDIWDIAQSGRTQEGTPSPMTPTYMVASLPGENRAEFLLTIPFTPRARQNLAGLLMARCDGEHLGELVVLQMSKQQLVPGPVQVDANINQDQTISKDLTLWNQQGSSVVRGQMLVLPVGDTFVYIEPIYLKAAQAPMPQLRKIAMAVGNHLIYTDTYDEALVQLAGIMQGTPAAPGATPPVGGQPAAASLPPPGADQRLDAVRQHLRKYRDLAAQGRWSEAGKELEAIEAEVRR